MESVMDPSALEGMEDDPRAMGQMMKKMGKEMGEDCRPNLMMWWIGSRRVNRPKKLNPPCRISDRMRAAETINNNTGEIYMVINAPGLIFSFSCPLRRIHASPTTSCVFRPSILTYEPSAMMITGLSWKT